MVVFPQVRGRVVYFLIEAQVAPDDDPLQERRALHPNRR